MRQNRSILALALAASLAGCFGGKVPASLLRLTPSASVAPQAARTAAAGQAVTVAVPTVPQELRTMRVPVQTGGTVAYLKDALWVEMPASAFARLLSETIGARTGRVVLDPLQFTLDPGLRLTGQLQNFGIDAARNEAVVTYDAAVARGTDRVETRRFEARLPVAAIDPASAGDALNRAANQVAAEVAAWVGG